MFHVHINVASRINIIGFECGTRADFDKRHGGDSAWTFLDHHKVNQKVNKEEFFENPRNFYIDKYGFLQKIIQPNLGEVIYLIDEDGSYLTDPDGAYLLDRTKKPYSSI